MDGVCSKGKSDWCKAKKMTTYWLNTDLERLESKESFKMCLEQVGSLK